MLWPFGDDGVGLLLKLAHVGASGLPDGKRGGGLGTSLDIHLIHGGHLHSELCGGLEGGGFG